MNNASEVEAGVNMLKDLAQQLAADAGIKLSGVGFDDGRPLGVSDMHILSLTARGKTVIAKINHEEVEDYPGRVGIDLTKAKVRNAIERLSILLEG
jgi:hypothetical protein